MLDFTLLKHLKLWLHPEGGFYSAPKIQAIFVINMGAPLIWAQIDKSYSTRNFLNDLGRFFGKPLTDLQEYALHALLARHVPEVINCAYQRRHFPGCVYPKSPVSFPSLSNGWFGIFRNLNMFHVNLPPPGFGSTQSLLLARLQPKGTQVLWNQWDHASQREDLLNLWSSFHDRKAFLVEQEESVRPIHDLPSDGYIAIRLDLSRRGVPWM